MEGQTTLDSGVAPDRAFTRGASVFILGRDVAEVSFIDTFEFQFWWLALIPVAALIAAIGVALKARWGTFVTYAMSALFVIYWSWGVIRAARVGVFQSRPPLEAALSLIPGIAFGLLAGFCSYASKPGADQFA